MCSVQRPKRLRIGTKYETRAGRENMCLSPPHILTLFKDVATKPLKNMQLLLQTQHHPHAPVSLNWVREDSIWRLSIFALEIIHVQCKSLILVLYIRRTEWIRRRTDRLSREVGKPGPVKVFATCSQLNRVNEQIHNWEPALFRLSATQLARRTLDNQWHERLKP